MDDELLRIDDSLRRTRELRELRTTLKALSETGSAQPALFPQLAFTGDDLRLEFDLVVAAIRDNEPGNLPPECLAALEAIERQLAAIGRDASDFDADVWTDAAMRESAPWAEVRRLARAALEALDTAADGPAADPGGPAPVPGG